jgi:ankyrin repeat protein
MQTSVQQYNKTIEIENYICPICHNLLLDPVVASDTRCYNRACLERLIEQADKKGKCLKSPMTNKPMKRVYLKSIDMRNNILNLIQHTNIFDEYLKDISFEEIDDFDIRQILISCGKMPKVEITPIDEEEFLKILNEKNEKKVLLAMERIGEHFDYNLILKRNRTFLITACIYGMETVVIKLLERYQDIDCDVVTNKGNCALDIAYRKNMDSCVLKMLDRTVCQSIKILDHLDEKGNTFLIRACKDRKERIAIKLLDLDVDYNATNNDLNSALLVACDHNMKNIALKLLDKKDIKYNQINNGGSTALINALCGDPVMYPVVEKLLSFDDINYRHINGYGNNALLRSIVNGSPYSENIINRYIADEQHDVKFHYERIICTLLGLLISNRHYKYASILLQQPKINIRNVYDDVDALDLIVLNSGCTGNSIDHMKRCIDLIIGIMKNDVVKNHICVMCGCSDE